MNLRAFATGLLIAFALSGCGGGAGMPKFLKKDDPKSSPNLSEGDAEGADSGQGLDEPIPVAGAFLVCSEDQSLRPDATAFEFGCRMENAAGERIAVASDAVPQFAIFAPDGSSLGYSIEKGEPAGFWEWRFSTDPAFPFPVRIKALLTKGSKLESFESQVTRQPDVISLFKAFQLGDNALGTPITVVPGVNCAAVTSRVVAETHGKALVVSFNVAVPFTRVRLFFKGVCGAEPSFDLRLTDVAAAKEIVTAKVSAGDSSAIYALAKGKYEIRLLPTAKAEDLDDFVAESLTMQSLRVGDVTDVAAAIVK